MFPNMFPLATGQVYFPSFLSKGFVSACLCLLYLILCYFVFVQQFGALPIMPVQAMTQQVGMVRHTLNLSVYFLFFLTYIYIYIITIFFQATRHARRVYVGGLPPTANEQVLDMTELCIVF